MENSLYLRCPALRPFQGLQDLLQEQVSVCTTEPGNTESGNWLSYKAALLMKSASLLASLEVAYAAKNAAHK